MDRKMVLAKEAHSQVHRLLKATGLSLNMLAQGISMAYSQLSRIATKKTGRYRAETLLPLRRAEILYQEARKTLSKKGIRRWLSEPNPYLNDVPPILCLRSDKELEKVLSLLASIRYGFPA